MGMNWLAKIAGLAEVPVFVAIGEGAPADTASVLCNNSELRSVESPRAAAILLVVGTVPDALLAQLHRLHDQMPHPRATVLWQSRNQLTAATSIGKGKDVGDALRTIHKGLLAGSFDTEPDILPDAPPNEWRGIGPHGQGGKGMMGGTPYGRPMAMTSADLRDGLELDVYTADFGPFLPMLPPGLVLTLTLQGDVIQGVAVVHPPFATQEKRGWILLNLLGLPALAERLLGASHVSDATLKRLIRLSGARAAIPKGLGRTHDGSDVRTRFDILTGTPEHAMDVHAHQTGLDDLLIGLEWHEAMLVLNSFDNAILRAICANTTDPEPAKGMESGMDHGAHAGHMS